MAQHTAQHPQQSGFNPAPPRAVAIEVEPPTPDEVFLTPRVVDESAFDRFAGDLRRLIQDAATAGRALVRTGSETDRHLTAMREATKELRNQVETGARLIPTIDQRIKHIDEALAKAEDRAALEEKITQHINQIIEDRIGAATAKATDIAGRMGNAVEKAAEFARAISEKLDTATRAATETADRVEALAARLTAETERAEKLIELARTSTDEGEQRLGTALTEAEVASQTLTKTISGIAEEIEPSVAAARTLIAEAQRTATDPTLTEAVKTGESAKRTLLRAIREAKSIVEQTDEARRQLADDLEIAAARIDAVAEANESLEKADEAATSDEGPIQFRRTDG